MLPLPATGIERSVKEHNSNRSVFLDWIEGGALFSGIEFSQADVIKELILQSIYEDEDYCSGYVENAWELIRNRISLINGYSIIALKTRRISLIDGISWQSFPAYSFLIFLSLKDEYLGYRESFGDDYNEQGELFELVSIEAVKCHFPGWDCNHFGRSRRSSGDAVELIQTLSTDIDEVVCDKIEDVIGSRRKDIGLDVALYKKYPDKRGAYPTYLMQCASGKNWTSKLKEPDLDVWTKLIRFKHPPIRAFTMPHYLDSREYSNRACQVNGLLLDRYRLLSTGVSEVEWVSASMKERIIEWLQPRIEWLQGK